MWHFYNSFFITDVGVKISKSTCPWQNVFKVYYTDSNISSLPIEFYIELNQAWVIQMTGTLDSKVIPVPTNSQNFILSSFSYHSWEKHFV
jgi:hypothetical protein